MIEQGQRGYGSGPIRQIDGYALAGRAVHRAITTSARHGRAAPNRDAPPESERGERNLLIP
jgi:hypothetical protein